MTVVRRAALVFAIVALVPVQWAAARSAAFGVASAPGAPVVSVAAGGAAEGAGIQPGDLIVSFDDASVSGAPQLIKLLGSVAEGEHQLEVVRAGSRLRLELRLERGDAGRIVLGAVLAQGFVVGDVADGSRVTNFPLRRGDVVQRCNGAPTATLEAFEACAADVRDKKLEIVVMRGEVQLVLRKGTVEWTRLTVEGAPNAMPGGRGHSAGGRGGANADAAPRGRIAERTARFEAAQRRGNSLLADDASRKLLEEATAKSPFAAPASAARRLAAVNVLRYALFAADGTVTFVGDYDPAYATGPIDYAALLGDAVENPYPKFSLDPAGRDPLDMSGFRAVDADMERARRDEAYAAQLGNKLLVQPLLQSRGDNPDRDFLAARLRRMFDISKEEFEAYRTWNHETVSDAEFPLVGGFLDKLLAGGGAQAGAGRLFIALKDLSNAGGLSPQEVRPRLERVALAAGLSAQLAEIDRAVDGGGDRGRLSHEFLCAMYERLMTWMGTPEGEVASLIRRFREGRIDEGPLQQAVNEAQTAALEKSLLRRVFAAFPLSQATLGPIYNVPPVMSKVETYGGRRDAALMKVFFDADYALKYAATANVSTETIEGHLPSEAYLGEQENAAGGAQGRAPTMGNIRFWLRPGDVALQVIGDRGGVRFASAGVRIDAEPLALAGGDRKGEAFVARTMSAYAETLTGRYDEYARAFPSLHALREASKVIALARWARSRGIALRPATAGRAAAPLPERVEGFWGMTFVYRPGAASDVAYLWAHGGVDYGQTDGDAWVKAEPSPKATSDVLEQLAASASLAGRASSAAIGGDMEQARDLAQRSADAMIGKIDVRGLPDVPTPAPLAPGESPAGRAEVAKAALSAAESNADALAKARADVKEADAKTATDPAGAAQLRQAALATADNSERNLAHLRDMMEKYRLAPADSSAMVVDLRNLDPSRPIVVAPPAPAPAVRAAGCPIAPKKRLPSRAELIRELVGLRARLDSLRLSLTRLDRTIQMDTRQFAEWEKEAQDAADRAAERLRKAIDDKIEEGLFDYGKEYFTKVDPAPDKVEALENVELLLKERDVHEWADKGERTWAQVAEGVKLLGENLPLGDEARSALWACENILDSSFDIAATLVSWRRINELEKNSDAYLVAVKRSGERMRLIVARMKEIEAQLAGGGPPPGAAPRAPQGAVCD